MIKITHFLGLTGAIAWAAYALGRTFLYSLNSSKIERVIFTLLHYTTLDLLVVVDLDEKKPADPFTFFKRYPTTKKHWALALDNYPRPA